MKKFLPLSLLFLLAACSSDDDATVNPAYIVNKWYITGTTFSQDNTNYDEGYIPCETDYYEFSADYKFREIGVSQCSETVYSESEYSINGNQVTRNNYSTEIVALSKNQMKIKEQVRYFVTPVDPVIETVIVTYKPVSLQ